MRRLALFLILFLGGTSLCFAGLFTDDEAHQQIAALQQQIQGMEGRVAQMESIAQTQGVGLLSQLDALKSDLAALRGQIEVHTHDIEVTQKRQRDLYVDLDNRLRKLERAGGPVSEAPVTDSGKPAAAEPMQAAPPVGTDVVDETKEYDTALALFRAGNYQGAIAGFQRFIGTHSQGALAPSAHYWIGNSYFNLRDYKNAIASQQELINQFPDSPKVPDAMLNMASCQQGLNDATAARKTLESIVAKYPLSNAAVQAKNRLSKIK